MHLLAELSQLADAAKVTTHSWFHERDKSIMMFAAGVS